MSAKLKPLSELTGALATLDAAKPAPGAVTLRYEVELITPMMGGGVLAGTPDDKGLPFRTRSLRGQLRMWWRILARSGLLKNLGEPTPSTPAQWRAAERAVWGGMSDNESRTDRPVASAVGLWINPKWISAPVPISYNEQVTAIPGLRYALFPAQPTEAERRMNRIDGKNLIKAGAKFELLVTVKDVVLSHDVRQVMAHWATFGGLGARTRRGLGAVRVKQLSDVGYLCVLPLDQWKEAIGTRKAPTTQGEEQCYRDDQNLVRAVSRTEAFGAVYVRGMANASAGAALALVVQKLQQFRQAPGTGRNAVTGAGANARPGQSRWPEAHILRKRSGTWLDAHSPDTRTNAQLVGVNCLPRADFGLPIVMHFKDGPDARFNADQEGRDPATRTLLPVTPDIPTADRMASPLILRAVALPSGETFMPVALLLDVARLEGRTGRLLGAARIDPQAGTTTQLPVWSSALTSIGEQSPLHRFRRGDAFPVASSAVEAFLNYFVSRGA